MKTSIIKTKGPVNISTLILPSHSEHCFTVSGRDYAAMHRLLRSAAEERQAVILNRFVFAPGRYHENLRGNMTAADGLATWLQGDTCRETEISSMQAWAMSGTRPQSIKIKGRETGFVYEDEYARYCRLSGVYPENLNASRPAQAREVFKIMKSTLEEQGFGFTDTVRTWFALNRLLEWYKEFNRVRTTFFEENDVFVKMVPASTGVGPANQFGAALICDLLAVQPKTSQLKIQSVPSPMQRSALNYRSSFSRAVELAFPTHRSLLVSGTASIAKDGQSAHAGNPERQIDLTMHVVEAILRSRKMEWKDLFRGIAYFKNMDDRIFFDKYCANHAIPAFSLAVAHLDLCRKDLLFEIEVDAVKITE
ncbi:MAG: hypothetical protein KJ964_09285 [Verrucomicrobia bacterium]|nr:hypothetical protein [Verrucomicrobiota bacterium]MBU1734069.1 hypothetical protein [Verrucomicrobiota bacterium]MBU1855721.1 hypothetical protein [Verrucomicrobiota bacterium]